MKRVRVTFCYTSNPSISYSNYLREFIQIIKVFLATHHVSKQKNKPHLLRFNYPFSQCVVDHLSRTMNVFYITSLVTVVCY